MGAQTSPSIVFHLLIDILILITERSLKEYPRVDLRLEPFTENFLGKKP